MLDTGAEAVYTWFVFTTVLLVGRARYVNDLHAIASARVFLLDIDKVAVTRTLISFTNFPTLAREHRRNFVLGVGYF